MAKTFGNISKNNKNIKNTSNISDLTNFFSTDTDDDRGEVDEKSSTPSVKSVKNLADEQPAFVRQTVIMAAEDLDFMRNLVYTKRLEGRVNYTQKDALQEMVAHFRAHFSVLRERPDDVRQDEQRRSQSIMKGKK